TPHPNPTPLPYTTLFRSTTDNRQLTSSEVPYARHNALSREHNGATTAIGPAASTVWSTFRPLADHIVPVADDDIAAADRDFPVRSEEHTSELQSPDHLVC